MRDSPSLPLLDSVLSTSALRQELLTRKVTTIVLSSLALLMITPGGWDRRRALVSSNARGERKREEESRFGSNHVLTLQFVIAFCLDLHWMSEYEVRDSFERYGATAYFNAAREPLAIDRFAHDAELTDFHNGPMVTVTPNGVRKYLAIQRSVPGDATWEHAKWAVKVSVMTEITLIDHLLWAHLVSSPSTHIFALDL